MPSSGACLTDWYRGAPDPVGKPACPCLTSAVVSVLLAGVTKAKIEGEEYPAFTSDAAYKSGYGVGCGPHDANTVPYCVPHWNAGPSPLALDGSEVVRVFCGHAWCWVDANDCDVPTPINSTYFEGVNLAYSYETCSAINVFSPFYESETSVPRNLLRELFIGACVILAVVIPVLICCVCVYVPNPCSSLSMK